MRGDHDRCREEKEKHVKIFLDISLKTIAGNKRASAVFLELKIFLIFHTNIFCAFLQVEKFIEDTSKILTRGLESFSDKKQFCAEFSEIYRV